jgi:hypothetical protein
VPRAVEGASLEFLDRRITALDTGFPGYIPNDAPPLAIIELWSRKMMPARIRARLARPLCLVTHTHKVGIISEKSNNAENKTGSYLLSLPFSVSKIGAESKYFAMIAYPNI